MESEWAQENGWLGKLVKAIGFDPYVPHYTRLLNNSFNGFRRSLRRCVEEYADQ